MLASATLLFFAGKCLNCRQEFMAVSIIILFIECLWEDWQTYFKFKRTTASFIWSYRYLRNTVLLFFLKSSTKCALIYHKAFLCNIMEFSSTVFSEFSVNIAKTICSIYLKPSKIQKNKTDLLTIYLLHTFRCYSMPKILI